MEELFKQNDRITIEGKVYYINNIPSIRYPEYPYYQLKTIYGDTLEFVHADLPLPTETDQAFNRINHGMEEFMVQDIMSGKKNYINFYGIYKERLYRLTAITSYNHSDYSVWNKKSKVAHHFPEEIYGSISYDKNEFALPDHFTFWIRVGKKFNGKKLDEIRTALIENPELILSKKKKKEPYSMIVNVQGPIFQRFTGNEDPDTFDIIRIEILLRAFSDNSIELCREHKDELLEAAIDKLKSSVKFRNFGVPINFLKVYDIVLTHDHRVILSLCLKDLS